MSRSTKSLWWLPALIVVLTIGVYIYWSNSATGAAPATPPEASPVSVKPTPAPQSNAEAEAPSLKPPSLNTTASQEPAPEKKVAQCARDNDCGGPKLADCITFHCVEGVCEYNKSRCECTENADCDDDVSCTRDLCFSNTMKCIHVKENCDEH